jgi:hypothetical protein
MPVHVPRRVFAAPLVLTLACGSSAKTEPEPVHDNPPPQHTNNPPSTDPPPPEVIHVNPPPLNPPPPEPEPPQPASERHWTISMASGKCQAFSNDACPPPPPGQPIPPCNPPVPTDYTCLSSMHDGDSLQVVQLANTTECVIPQAHHTCPPKAHCNPPPIHKVPCP